MDNSLRRAVCLVCLSSCFASSFAATPPPDIPILPAPQKARLQPSPFAEVAMGGLNVRLEKTSLDEVRTAASSGAIAHQGDAGASIYWLCYTNLNATPAERIWLVSDGEMGGREHSVTSVIAQRSAGAHASADCPAMPATLAPMKLESGIWLDTPPETARKILGAASFHSGNWESYDYQGKVPGSCAGAGFDLTSSLMLQAAGKRFDTLRISRITSC
ncbi:hypothetical protein GJ697_22540 [Pseudoduganella sp. FT25W]|uniref:DUF1566 domain-containing protein n=1 Tax=Duganella alba TaxID=2666081 RepID=A0A6L5QLT3_9BURK|nr:hypothetical protein [Duganella alba]MRX10615.1 hypothetical protein [Duganella alba]MRX15766.1 hypothetical protein [Duganella alba]